jgi:hypothetical protein
MLLELQQLLKRRRKQLRDELRKKRLEVTISSKMCKENLQLEMMKEIKRTFQNSLKMI